MGNKLIEIAQKVEPQVTATLGISGALSGNIGIQALSYLPGLLVKSLGYKYKDLLFTENTIQHKMKNIVQKTCDIVTKQWENKNCNEFVREVCDRINNEYKKLTTMRSFQNILDNSTKKVKLTNCNYVTSMDVKNFIDCFEEVLLQEISKDSQLAILIFGKEIIEQHKKIDNHETYINKILGKESDFQTYPKAISNLPSNNPYIYGNSRYDLERYIIRILFKDNKNILLCGSGGIGKTSVAKSIYKRMVNDTSGIIKYIAWIPYIDSLDLSIYNASKKKDNEHNVKIFAKKWIEEHDRMLLIIDNIDDIAAYSKDELLKTLDNYPIKVIITGRARVDNAFKPILIRHLEEKACRKLFCHYYCNKECCDKSECVIVLNRILGALYYHTITIELVAKIARIEAINVFELETKLKDFGINFSSKAVYADTYNRSTEEKSLSNHIKIIYSMSNCSKTEQTLLQQMSVIPRFIVDQKELQNWFGCDARTINRLEAKGWIERDEENQFKFFMNTIISQAILEQSDLKKVYMECKSFIGIVSKKLYVNKHGNENCLQVYIPYGNALFSLFFEYMNNDADIELIINLLNAYTYIGDYSGVIRFEQTIKKFYENNIDRFKKAKLDCIIGVSYQRLIKFDQAYNYYEKAKKVCSKEYKWAELILLNNMATAKHRSACFDEARKLYIETLKYCDNYDGKDDRIKELEIDCRNNYGALLSELAEKTAVDNCLQAFKDNNMLAKKDINDRNYIYTNIYMNLALTMVEVCDDKKMEQVLQELKEYEICSIIDLMQHAFEYRCAGNHHLSIATVKHNISVINFIFEDDIDLALKYTEEAMKSRIDYYGKGHPSSMSSMVNLGTFCLLKKDETNVNKGIKLYKSLINEIKALPKEYIINVRQIPHIIKANLRYFDMECKLKVEIGQYTMETYQVNSKRQVHETYGKHRCCDNRPNFIINKEVSNITIANK